MSAIAAATASEPGRVAASRRKPSRARWVGAVYGERPVRISSHTSSPAVCQSLAYIPGSSAVADTPHATSSSRRPSVSASMACLDAAYGASIGLGTRPESDETLMILPQRWARRCGATALTIRHWPRKLVSNCRRSSSSLSASIGPHSP